MRNTFNKNLRRIALTSLPFFSLLLCSFAPSNSEILAMYHESKPTTSSSINGKKVGTDYKKDLGRRNWIGYYIKYNITSIAYYKKSTNNAYIFSYGDFSYKNAMSSISESFSISYSESYTFGYQTSFSSQYSNALSAELSLAGFGSVKSGATIGFSSSSSYSYSFTTSKMQTASYDYSYNLDSVPDFYELAPAVVCDATIISFKYTIYDKWWWGDFESRDKSEVDQKNAVFIYYPSSFVKTLVIRPHTSSSAPELYL